MNLEDLTFWVIDSFQELNLKPLDKLDENSIYSDNYKDEIIEELNQVFKKIKAKGISTLKAKPSKCKYCYPSGKAYSFHHPITDEFIIRYVIHKEKEGIYRVQECKNKPLPDGENGMPF